MYGHNVDPAPFMYIHENGLYTVEDQEVLLPDLSLSPAVAPTTLPLPPSLSGMCIVQHCGVLLVIIFHSSLAIGGGCPC